MNLFGGLEVTELKKALNRNNISYNLDVIDKINEMIQGSKFHDKIKLKKLQKNILKDIVKTRLLYNEFYTFMNISTILKKINNLLNENTDDLMKSPYVFYLRKVFFILLNAEYDTVSSNSYHFYKSVSLNNFVHILYKLKLINNINNEFYTIMLFNDEIYDYFLGKNQTYPRYLIKQERVVDVHPTGVPLLRSLYRPASLSQLPSICRSVAWQATENN